MGGEHTSRKTAQFLKPEAFLPPPSAAVARQLSNFNFDDKQRKMSGRISSDLLLYQQTSYKELYQQHCLCENEEVNAGVAVRREFFGTSL